LIIINEENGRKQNNHYQSYPQKGNMHMRKILTALMLVICLIIALVGCARTYWADDDYDDNRTLPRATANVSSSPQINNQGLPQITRGNDRNDTGINRNMGAEGRNWTDRNYGTNREMGTDRNTSTDRDILNNRARAGTGAAGTSFKTGAA
jgi:hypothetical protein